MSFAKGIVLVLTVYKAFHFALGWLPHGALEVGDYFLVGERRMLQYEEQYVKKEVYVNFLGYTCIPSCPIILIK